MNENHFSFLSLSTESIIKSPLIQNFICIILMILQALLLNNIVTKHKFSRALSTIPAASLVVVFALTFFTGLNLNMIVANFFCLLSINSLFKLYKVFQPVTTIYNAGFFLCLASLFYPPYLVFLPVWFLCLYSLRNLKLKESLQLISGFLTPFFFLFIYHFNQDSLDKLSPENIVVFPQTAWPDDLRIIILASLLAVIIVTLVTYSNELKKKKKFDSIKKIEFLYWMLLASLFSLFFAQAGYLVHFVLVSIPLSILLGLMLENKKNGTFKETIFIAMLTLLFFFQYGYALMN